MLLSIQADQIVAEHPCEGSIPFVPFRYAVVPKAPNESSNYLYESCEAKLDVEFEELQMSAYSIRTLRPGYIYLYDEEADEKKRIKLWEVDGSGNYYSLEWADLEDYRKIRNKGSAKPNIEVCDSAKIVYIAYSPDLWSKDGVKKNIDNRELFMTKVNVEEILDGSGSASTQKHILPSNSPESWIEEYKISHDGYDVQFSWSSFVPEQIISMRRLKNLNGQYANMHRPKLPVFLVLYDNIATAIDVGNIAALYMHQLYDIKKQPGTSAPVVGECKPLPDELKLDCSSLDDNSVEFHHKKMISEIIDGLLRSTYPGNDQKLDYEILRYQKRIRNHPDHNFRMVGDSEARLEVLSNEDVNTNAGRIIKHIKLEELKEFQKEYDQEQKRISAIEANVLKATCDHKILLSTMDPGRCDEPRNIATTLETYDRDSLWSACALEEVIAFSIQGMGIPVPGNSDKDTRYQLLKLWAEDEKSPLFTGVKAYNKFSKKIDSTADAISGIGDLADELHKIFPYAIGTNIIVNEVTAYSLTKARGETRWNRSKSVVRNVNEALEGSKLKDLFKALQGRYNIVSKTVQSSDVTKEVYKIIDLSTGEKISRSLDISGTRAVKITETITRKTSELNSVSKTMSLIKSSALPAGVAWMHFVNLMRASEEFRRDDSVGATLNLSSALFGFAGAFNEVAVLSIKTKMARKIIGEQAQMRAFKVLGNTTVLKSLGYVGAALEGAVHFHAAGRSMAKGDRDAAGWAGATGVSLATGGAMLTYYTVGAAASYAAGAFGVAGASATVPGPGWLICGVILIGVGIVTAYKKVMAEDRPMEVWVSRTVFGIERRDGWFGGGDVVMPSFPDSVSALQGYYNTAFCPVKISDLSDIQSENDDKTNRINLPENAESNWIEHGISKDEGRFLILLPGFSGISEYAYRLDNYEQDNVDSLEDASEADILQSDLTANIKESEILSEGKYIYFNKTFSNSSTESASLKIKYWPGGFSKDPVVKTFFIDE